MAIDFRCIRCGQKLRVHDADAGNMARCPSCEAIVDIPPQHALQYSVEMAREKADVIDFELFGKESQHVEITLDPSEAAFANMEHLLYMTPGIAVEDAAETSDRDSGGSMFRRISQFGRRLRGAGSLQMQAFCNVASGREVVGFAPKSPGRLLPLPMEEFNQQIICPAAAILCLARGIEIREKELSVASTNLEFCELRGDGLAVLQTSGHLFHQPLGDREQLNVASARILAVTSTVTIGAFNSAGVSDPIGISSLCGPGEVWLASGTEIMGLR